MYPLKKHCPRGGEDDEFYCYILNLGNHSSPNNTHSYFSRARAHNIILAISSFPSPSPHRQTKLHTRKNSLTLTVSFALRWTTIKSNQMLSDTSTVCLLSEFPNTFFLLFLSSIYNIITDCTKKRLRSSIFLISLFLFHMHAHAQTQTYTHIQTLFLLVPLCLISSQFIPRSTQTISSRKHALTIL